MQIQKIIPWTFWNKKIKINIFPNTWNKKVIINISWLYGWENTPQKYKNFSEKILENNLANFVVFKSSRLDLDFDENISKFENKKKKFDWKTFENELKDAENVIFEILENSEKYFQIKKENLEITLIWNSLWWAISFFLASKFTQIKNISTVWTGLRKEKWEWSILQSFPDLEIYKEKIENFSGSFLQNIAENDEIFSKNSYDEFFNLAKNCKIKKQIIYPWVNHSFKKYFGEKSEKPLLELFSNLKNFLKK